MATDYPTTPLQTFESRRTPIQSMRTLIADDGSVHGVSLHASPTYEFTVVHENLTSVEVSSIMVCYASNTAQSFQFQWQGDQVFYTTVFTGRPKVIEEYGGRFRVESNMVGKAT